MNALERAEKAGDKKYIITCEVYEGLKVGVHNKKTARIELVKNNIGSQVLDLWLVDLRDKVTMKQEIITALINGKKVKYCNDNVELERDCSATFEFNLVIRLSNKSGYVASCREIRNMKIL